MRPKLSSALAGALMAGGLAVGCGGGGSDGSPPPKQVVTLLSTTCTSGVGNLPNTSCLLLRVNPSSTNAVDVELRVTEHTTGVPYLGTVVLLSGGTGTDFFANIPGGEELIRELADVGLRVVDRRWLGGWLNTGKKMKPESSRLPELLDWIDQNEHQGGVLYAIGNSGGSAELAFALTTWGRETLFDQVVMIGGPPFTRLDYICRPAVPAWSALCPSFIPTLECGVPPCEGFTTNLCQGLPSSFTAAELAEDSILHPGADTDFGPMTTHFVFGADDCTPWVPQGLLFESAVTSGKSFQLVPSTPHTVSQTQQGRDAILQALLGFVPYPATAAGAATHFGVQWVLLEDGEPAASVRAVTR